jgi:hypothetical protein
MKGLNVLCLRVIMVMLGERCHGSRIMIDRKDVPGFATASVDAISVGAEAPI